MTYAKWVSKLFEDVYGSCSIGAFEAILKRAREAEARGEWKDFNIVSCSDREDGDTIRIEGLRPENSSEIKHRLDVEKKWSEDKELKELAEFERLKKKFEVGNEK